MAYTINEQPTKLGFSRTPILYLVHDDLYIEDSFQYIADVYLWQGLESARPTTPQYQLRKPPDTKLGDTTFDIKTLTTDWLVTPEFNFGSDPNFTKEMYVWAQVSFGYIYIDTGGSVVETHDVVAGNTINVTNGYNYYMEGINFEPTNYLGTNVDDFWLTSRPLEMNIPLETSMYMFCFNGINTGGTITKIYVRVNGAITSILDLNNYDSEMVAVGCGSKEVAEQYAPPGTELSYWEIWGTNDALTEETQRYRFNVVDNCKYGFKNLQFLNRFGVWDNIICYGTQKENLMIERTEILHSPLEVIESTTIGVGEYYFNKPFGQFHMANIHGREELTINTGWIKEDWNELMKQLMLTQYIYDSDTMQPLTLADNALALKTSLNDKMISYSIKLKLGYTAVNTVG